MKQIYVLLFSLLGINAAFAQDKGMVAVLVGYNQPILDFASTKLNNGTNSFGAKPCISYEVTGTVHLNKTFGIAALYRYQSNDFDVNTIKSNMMSGAPTGFNLTYTMQAYSIHTLMAGLNATFPLTDDLSFDNKALVGMAIVEARKGELKADYLGATTGNSTGEYSKSQQLSAMLTSGLQYKLNKHLSALGNVSIWTTKYKGDVKSTDLISGGSSSKSGEDFIWTLNYNLGLGYHF